MSVRIQNVVAKLDLKQPLELEKFVRLPDIDVQYKPAVFPGVIIKDGEGPTFLLFKSGRGVCVGAKAVDKCVEAARKLFDKLVKHGVVDDSGVVVEIQNIVASAELGFPVELEKAAKELDRIMYEPEQFPAAILYIDRPRVSMLLFANGKVIIAGAKAEEEIMDAYRKIIAVLERFRPEEVVA